MQESALKTAVASAKAKDYLLHLLMLALDLSAGVVAPTLE
jgi:hypothetical protein